MSCSPRRTTAVLSGLLGGLVLAAFGLGVPQRKVQAVPAFAAQTGQPCTACHIGGFGPQLTPFGRAFKIGGYVQTGGQGWEAHMPLSGMLQGSFSHYGKNVPDDQVAHGFNNNNNFAFDQASIFIAGRAGAHTGGFMQLTYSNIDNRGGGNGLAVDNTDLRPYTTTVQAFGNDLTLGISVNNNPTVQDPYNSTFAWGFPYYGTDLAPAPGAATLLAGTLGGNSIGVTGYAWYNEHFYFEAGGYGAMSPWLSYRFGVEGGPVTSSLAPYVRAAYEWDWGNNSAWVGATFMSANINPELGTATDNYTDYALDGGYEYVGSGKNTFAVQGIFVHENQNLKGSAADYNANSGAAPVGSSYGLNSFNINGQYWYDNTYGLTLAYAGIWGDANPILYQPGEYGGFANNKPNTNAFTIEADWVPFGKEKSWARPWANLKLGIQYTLYTEFNGGNSNYDGSGRNASDNNTLLLEAWTLF